jgi:16S rRNA (guanine527-N7)-methyltransferase
MIDSEEAARSFCARRTDTAGLERLERLAAMLAEEIARQNLISAASLGMIWQRQFADSLQLLDHVPRGTTPWLDLGTGAGFPGLALACVCPDARIIMVESRKRRVEWLERVRLELALATAEVIGSRVENVVTFATSVITARAFAPLSRLLQLSARFSTQETAWLLPKGRSAAQELAEQPPAVQKMFHVEHSVTDPHGGILVGRGTPPFR